MSCVIEIGLYTRNAFRWIQKSWKPIMRHASSKHLWPGSQELMNIGGVSHFNGDSEVDQMARGFLNKNTTSDDQHKIGKCTLQGNTAQEVEGLYTNQELKQELDQLGVDCKAMDALINKCAVAVTELEKYLSMKGTKPLATGDLKEAQDALAVAGISMKDVEQSNIIFRGAINIVRSDLHKDLPQVKTEGALGKIQNETQGNIYSYKAFPTIEVPLAPPAQKTDSSDAFDPDKYDVSTDTTETEKSQEAQMQTVLDDSKSRILMRYALLKALYVLEAGGKNCKAKIVFNDPKNTEG